MAEPDYSKVFETYKKLPPSIKKEFDDFRAKKYAEGSPPPEQMQRDLDGIVAKHETRTQSPAVASARGEIKNSGMRYAAGLAAVLIAVAFASSGMPYAPPVY